MQSVEHLENAHWIEFQNYETLLIYLSLEVKKQQLGFVYVGNVLALLLPKCDK